ncbi:S41 family peptidase [Pyxidicoccus xibeiensis]|uniref:S41 family peptidase n=1 Tax=Pyxidicoccus xibeiensis TaxID=2906759 RepID=UPI0020A8352F|nr:S41 family peptidase [Pyxidicoccus xibeiensis]MCP3143230.1 S41 family peptidase [Pyxidicoccus xibeiensis]
MNHGHAMTAAGGRGACRAWLGALLSAALLLPGAARAQGPSDEGEPVDAALRVRMVTRVSETLNETYVFPDVAKKMEARLRQRLKAGAYDGFARSGALAAALTRDLQDVSRDKHLVLRYATAPHPEQDSPGPGGREQLRRAQARTNFGFQKLERLTGNVGYLDLRAFRAAELAGDTAIAAMGFLAHSDALIIDLRWNVGGEPSMIQLLSSYFFDRPTHLNSFYLRKANTTQQFWTSAHVPGKRMTDVPLYVLTSPRTFSAAEEFAYNLKHLKRATLVGETTGGGAHPIETRFLADVRVLAFIPFGRAVNPITGTNWEGTGVTPDLQVAADRALDAAHVEALKTLRARASDDARKARLTWALQRVEALAAPVTLSPEVLKGLAGTYGDFRLSYEDGSLWCQWRQELPRSQVIPLSADLFMLDDGMDVFRFRVEKDAAGRVKGLTALFPDGRTDRLELSGG